VTDAAAVIATTHVPVPEQPAPLQAVKVEPALGVAVRVTEVPWPKFAEQVAPQVMPAGRRRHGARAGACLGDRERVLDAG
jgi:hypothetical protein